MYVIRCSNVLYVIRCSNVLHVIRCFETTVQWGNTFTRTGPGILKRANDWLYCHHHHHNHCHHSLPQIIHNIVLFTSFPLQGTCLRRMWKGFCGEQQTETTPAGSHRGKAVPVHFWGLWKEILPRLQPEDTRAHTHGRPPLRLPLWGSDILTKLFSHVSTLQGCNKAFVQSQNLKSHILTHAKQKSGRGSVSSPDSVSGSHSNLDSHRCRTILIIVFILLANPLLMHVKSNQNWISALTSQTRHTFSRRAVSLYKLSLSR